MRIKLLSIVLCLVTLTGCQWASTSIRGEAVRDSVFKVADRHDSYANRELELQQSQDLRVIARQDAIDRTAFEQLLRPVARRHDDWVTRDQSLSPLQKRTYLRTTELLRQVAKRE